MAWPTRALLDLLGVEVPIIQAPMAGAQDAELAIAVSCAGGLGSLPCALLSAKEARAGIGRIRAAIDRPFNVNFFCHRPPPDDPQAERRWLQRLAPYYRELGVEEAPPPAARRRWRWCRRSPTRSTCR